MEWTILWLVLAALMNLDTLARKGGGNEDI